MNNQPDRESQAEVDTTTLYTVPVVFIVYHLGEPVGQGSNVSNETLQAQIDQLNRTFAGQKPNYFGVDTKIRFGLARRSPSCGPSNGIVRVDARSVPGYQENGISSGDRLKEVQLQALLPDYVINNSDQVVVVRVVHNVYGWAGAWAAFSGIYIPAWTINDPNNTVLTHEMGHILNLAHTFLGVDQYGNCPTNNNPEKEGDYVADTDPHKQYEPYNACDPASELAINSCTGRPFGLIGRNFMSYGCDTRMFTKGQALRMRTYLQNDHTGLIDNVYFTPPTSIDEVATACRPTSVSASTSHNEGLWRVSFGQIDYSSFTTSYNTGANYFDFSCTKRTTVNPGGSYRLDVLGMGRYRRAYIDYNNDGIFNESTERVLSFDSQTYPFIETSSIVVTIPNTAVVNRFLRMRVIVDNGSTPPEACNLPGGQNGSGEAEDYGIFILGNTPCSELITLKAGDWSDTSVWSCGKLPTLTDSVRLLHGVQIPSSFHAEASRLIYGSGGKLKLDIGAQLILSH